MRKCFYVLIIFSVFLHFSQCDRRKKFADEPLASAEISQGGVLVAALNVEPESLNPLTALLAAARDVISLIFQPLAKFNADLTTFQPVLAKSWDISPDRLKITFHLRTDVTWHDGQPFSAEDVVFTHELCVDPELAWDGISYKQNISHVTAENDSTVTFHFKSPSMTMLMDAVEGEIVPKHLLSDIPPVRLFESDFNRHPVGCGPFRFSEWRSQQYLILEKYPAYYIENQPHLARVVFKIVPDNVSLYQQLLSGEIDLAEGLLPADFNRLQNLWNNKKSPLCPVNYLGRQFDFIGWNLIEPKCYQQLTELPDDQKLVFSQWLIPHNLFGSQAVRAALTMAIDRAKIAKIVNEDQAIPMNGPIPPILWAYNSSANRDWKYNPAQAQKVLKKEGWIDVDNDGVLEKDGREFIFEMVTNSGNIRRQHVLTLLQEQFRAIGVKMIPRIIDPGYLTSRIIPNRDFDALLFGWTVGLKMDLTPLFHSSSFFQPFHFTSYYSSTYDSLDEIARTTLNRDHARQTWDKIAYLLSTDLPYTWLYYNMECSVIHQRFRNVVIDRRGMYNNVEEWWIPSVDQNELDRSYSK